MNDQSVRIDFYILDTSGEQARLRFACRLAEKAFSMQHRVHALAENEPEANTLDDLMWTFRAGSFLPHAIKPGANDPDTPVTIGFDADAAAAGDLLINLTSSVPVCFDRFQRIAEIIDGDEACRTAGRERFSFYRNNGFDPQTHRIS